MAKSSLLGIDRAPAMPAGRDIDARGPSDTSDSGSDIQGELDLGADAVGLPRGLALPIEHKGDTDAEGTGERGSAMPDDEPIAGADIGVDRVTGPAGSEEEPELQGLTELAQAGPEDEEENEEDAGDVAARPAPAPRRTVRTTRKRHA
jgi:hypothetical protein